MLAARERLLDEEVLDAAVLDAAQQDHLGVLDADHAVVGGGGGPEDGDAAGQALEHVADRR